LDVSRVRRVGARHPAGSVDEQRLHRSYNTASWSAAVRPSRERPTACAR
jgi:hypothetical protein